MSRERPKASTPRRRKSARRCWLSFLALAAGGLVLAACSNPPPISAGGAAVPAQEGGDYITANASATTAPAEAPSTVSASPSPSLTAAQTTAVLNYTGLDGSKAVISFQFGAGRRGNDPSLTQGFPNGIPCDADPTRDLVVPGDLIITNETPAFTPNLTIQIEDKATPFGYAGSSILNFGAGFSNGPECFDVDSENYDAAGFGRSAVDPQFNGSAHWQAPIEFVLHGYYSPAHPKGDPGMFKTYDPVIVGAFTAVSGPVKAGPYPGSVAIELEKFATG